MAKGKTKTNAKQPTTIQQLFDLGGDDNAVYAVTIFGMQYNVDNVEHVKNNVYNVIVSKGNEKREVALSAEHPVVPTGAKKPEPDIEDL